MNQDRCNLKSLPKTPVNEQPTDAQPVTLEGRVDVSLEPEYTNDEKTDANAARSVAIDDNKDEVKVVQLPVDHPGTLCAQFSCQCPVGWSKSRGRYAKLCDSHLMAHRQRCSKSALRRRQLNQEYRTKARMFDVQSMNLSSAHEEIERLRARLSETERELRRISSSSSVGL